MTVTSGANVSEPLAYFDPATRSLRTYQASLLASLDGSSTELFVTWPRSGTWDRTTFSARPSSAPRINGNGSGSSRNDWPTPRESDANGAGLHGSGGADLRTTSDQWATPRAEDGERGQGSQFDGLSEDVSQWGTPRASDAKDSGPVGSKSHGHMLDRDYLCAEVRSFGTGPTPPPSAEPMGPSDSSHDKPLKKPARGLNPRFGLWLMGFPTDWLDGITVEKPKRGQRQP